MESQIQNGLDFCQQLAGMRSVARHGKSLQLQLNRPLGPSGRHWSLKSK